jgi:prolipoprotein diacylglyceryl transferase
MNLVEFPGLWGLKFTISRVAFYVFGIPIYWYGIIIATGFLLAVLLGMRNSKKAGIDPDNILDLVLFAAPAAIIGARLFYVIFSWDLFKDNLIDIFNTRKGGLAIYGGVLAAFIVAFIFARKKKIGVLKLLDFGVPYLVMAQGIGRWGNFVNQEAFGSATTLPWRMNSDTVNTYLSNTQVGLDLTKWGVHPTFLYESIMDFAIFFFLLWFGKKKKIEGEIFYLYMILYGLGRSLIEGLRTDSLMLGNFRISRLLGALFFIVFAFLFIYGRIKKNKRVEEEEVEIGQSPYGSLVMKMKEEEKKEEIEKASIEHMKPGEEVQEDNPDIDESGNADEPSDESPDSDEKDNGAGLPEQNDEKPEE